MKRLVAALHVAVALLLSGCTAIDELNVRVDDLENRVTYLEALCGEMNANINSLKTIVDALQSNDYITHVTPIVVDRVEIGYTVYFLKADPITIYHGKDGKDGADGSTPVIGVKMASDGRYYWTLNGNWLLDDDGNKIGASAIDGKDGEDGNDGAPGADGKDGQDGKDGVDGKDGITPELKIEEGNWYISYDKGITWKYLGRAAGADGKDGQDGADGKDGKDGSDGDSFFIGVDYTSDPNWVIFSLVDGSEIKFPTWRAYEELTALCNTMNANLQSLKTLVEALQERDYVTGVSPLMSGGEEIGYTITFLKSGTITIYHGKDGQDGEDGKDGESSEDGEDGKTPVIGVRMDSDGCYYWTLNGDWLLDDDGNKVRASGRDGEDGKDGEDGITPELKIENNYWYVSYNGGDTWSLLGKATGADGKDGSSLFAEVSYDEDTVCFVLSDGTELFLPLASGYVFNRLKSLKYLPAYDDGRASVVYHAAEDSFVEIDFIVSPRDAAVEIAGNWERYLSMQAYSTQTRSVDFSEMPILSCYTDVDSGVITVVASGAALPDAFFTGEVSANAVLIVSDGITEIISDVVPMMPLPSDTPPNDEIWYSTSNGKVLNLRDLDIWDNPMVYSDVFGADIISNTYQDGKGIIKFDGNVTKIGDSAFANNYNEVETLVGIKLPDSVTSIGNHAFWSGNLSEITLPRYLVSIGEYAFRNCNLSEIIIPETVVSIADYAFDGNENLQKIENRSEVLSAVGLMAFGLGRTKSKVTGISGKLISDDGRCIIKDNVLIACATAGLTEYAIPYGVEAISDKVFMFGQHLAKVTFPSTLKRIGEEAFAWSDALLEVSIPSSVTEVGYGAFQLCANLMSISIQNDCIAERQFYNCPSLFPELTIPEKVTSIGAYAFCECGIETLILGNNITYIGDSAFENCKLKNVTIPESVDYIGDCAFKCATMEKFEGKYASGDKMCLVYHGKLIQLADAKGKTLKEYTIPEGVNEIGSSVFSGYSNLTSLTIPEGVEKIGIHGLNGCSGLSRIVLPRTITNLGNFVFCNCTGVSEIYFNSPTPPGTWGTVISGYWEPCDPGTVLRVPEGSVSAYRASPWWGICTIVGHNEEIYSSTDFSQDGVVTTLQRASDGNGIDIVIMGDGYSDRQIASGKYDNDINKAMEMFFSEEPYCSFRNNFNVYQVKAVSIGEGYGAGSTAFGGFFGEGTLVGGNDSKVLQYTRKAISDDKIDNALIIVIMNREYYAGTCYMYYPSGYSDYGLGTSISYFPLGTDDGMLAGLILHEAGGHGFAKLADEYSYESMGGINISDVTGYKRQRSDWGWWKNVDFTNAPSSIRWNYFLTDPRYANDGLGVYEGGLTYWSGVWRPTENSIMRHNSGGFNAPSREAIYYRIHKLAYGDTWEYDYEDFVEYDAINRKKASSSYTEPAYPKYMVPLHPPVLTGKSWRDL